MKFFNAIHAKKSESADRSTSESLVKKLILNDWRDTGAELSGNREKQVIHKERDHDAKQSIWIKVVSYVTISGSGFISVPRFYQNSEGL